jgi:hypothetical protein
MFLKDAVNYGIGKAPSAANLVGQDIRVDWLGIGQAGLLQALKTEQPVLMGQQPAFLSGIVL